MVVSARMMRDSMVRPPIVLCMVRATKSAICFINGMMGAIRSHAATRFAGPCGPSPATSHGLSYVCGGMMYTYLLTVRVCTAGCTQSCGGTPQAS